MKVKFRWVVLLITGFITAFFLYFHKWDDAVSNGGDSWGYYSYLPSIFIHGDIKDLESVIAIRQKDFPHSMHKDEKGKWKVGEASNTDSGRVIKYTYGLSMFYLPGFLFSHMVAGMTSFESNGYSVPYILGLYLSTILYILLGLWMLWKVLTQYFSSAVAATTLIFIGLGTNLFYFAVINNVMSHPILVFLWAALINFSDSFWRTGRTKHFLLAFAVGSAISIIRPAEVFCFLVLLMWNLDGIKSRISYFIKHYRLLIYGIFIGFAFLLPQLVYWKYTSGQWIYDSYPGEGFRFNDPNIMRGVFGFMNGWLPYSPLMILAVIGWGFMMWSRVRNWLLISLVLSLHVFIIYSWWNWYYINGFGSRPMVDIYPILAFPMALTIQKMFARRWSKVVLIILPFFIVLNMFQMYQHDKGILWTELGNLGYYHQAFGKAKFEKEISIALDMNEYQFSEYVLLDTLLNEDFENREWQFISDSIYRSGSAGYHINKTSRGDIGDIEVPYEMIIKDRKVKPTHFYFSIDVYVEDQITSFYDFDTAIIEYVRGDGSVYKRRYLRLNNKPGENHEISLWWGQPRRWDRINAGFRISSRFKKGHSLRIFFNKESSSSNVYVDNMRLYSAVR